MGSYLALLIPLFPLVAFFLLIAGREKWHKGIAASFSIGAVLISFVLSTDFFWQSFWQGKTFPSVELPWFTLGGKSIEFSISLEPLQVMMIFLVSLVSLLVQFYSLGYMKTDGRINTFFAYLSLFTSSMLGLVMSANLLQLYFFWELVGLCSFLLIGFWYYKESAKAAAKKAFIVTRIGDIGLFIALCLLFWQVGSFKLTAIKEAVVSGKIEPGLITLIAILIFLGAVGKSGQFPLHTWLPDAMEGPTPVSALIHAATMVAAGVFLVAQLFWLYEASPLAMNIVAYIGGFTAIFAASIGLVQNDLKRVLAYSTVSQLGYMMLALGSAGKVAGVFHLFTHGFFKALLFLAAGAVLVYYHHEPNIQNMGGLWKKEKWLGICFLVGCLSISGVPPFSGFFSKDEILLAVFKHGRIDLFVVALLTAILTSFYVFRLFFLVFFGKEKSVEKPGQITGTMKVPLFILSLLSIVAGFVQFPRPLFAGWIGEPTEHVGGWVIPVLAIGASLIGILLAYLFYAKPSTIPKQLAESVPWAYQLLYRKYFIDELYQAVFVLPLKGFGWLLSGFDRFVIGGLIYLVKAVTRIIGWFGSRLQNGQVQQYLLVSLFGLILLMVTLTAGRFWG
jgi:NADH-quinone oxidoreductase subunit L